MKIYPHKRRYFEQKKDSVEEREQKIAENMKKLTKQYDQIAQSNVPKFYWTHEDIFIAFRETLWAFNIALNLLYRHMI